MLKNLLLSYMLMLSAPIATMAQKLAQTTMSVDKQIHDFGSIPQNKPVTHTFKVKNTGKEPLLINKAIASCGCTTPEWTKEPIKPGKSGSVKVTFNAATPGRFNKAITIITNVALGSAVVNIKGDVIPDKNQPKENSIDPPVK